MPRSTDGPGRPDAYLICATPRTGSSLLCGLLESTGVAGRPESYFRRPDEQSWADRWGIARAPDGTVGYADYVHAAIVAGRTENGVFAARIMWGTLDEMVDKLGTIHPDLAGADLELLNRAFGRIRFVHLRRDDVLRQAVSWLRAEQTDVWFDTGHSRRRRVGLEPRFDADRIRDLIRMIADHEAAWRRWFASFGIRPHRVRYEDLDADPVGVTRAVLEFLGLEPTPGSDIVARHRRLADDLNTRWIDRYRAETASR